MTNGGDGIDGIDGIDFLPKRGAVAKVPRLEVGRELTAMDILRLGSNDGAKRQMQVHQPLQQIRAIHHRLAALLAQGLGNNEVAAIVGRTAQSISDLKNNDPAFKQLISYYQDQHMVAMMQDRQRLEDKANHAGEIVIDELTARLEDDAKRKNITTGDLVKVGTFLLDRGVLPPKAANTQPVVPANITLSFGTVLKVKEAEGPQAAAAAPEPKTINHEPEE